MLHKTPSHQVLPISIEIGVTVILSDKLVAASIIPIWYKGDIDIERLQQWW
jgi:hypothetical protein